MFFKLLYGSHVENKVTYSVLNKKSLDSEGNVIVNSTCPVIKSNNDLVKAFGHEKFQRLSEQDAALLLSEQDPSGDEDENSNSDGPADLSEVAKAVLQGAQGIQASVTSKKNTKHINNVQND